MLRIESWRIQGSNTPPGYAWVEPKRLKLENDSWSGTAIRWRVEPTGEGGELSPGNVIDFGDYTGPKEIRIELHNLASEAVGAFVARGPRDESGGEGAGK